MSRFMAIPQNIWHRQDFQQWSNEEKLIYLFLRSAPAQNALGCYVLSLPGLADDLRIAPRTVKRIISRFVGEKLIAFDEQSRLVYVVGHFDNNPIVNGNCALGAIKVLQELPKSLLMLEVARELLAHPIREQKKLNELIRALQIHAGAWLPGHEPLALPGMEGEPQGEGLGEPFGEPLVERLGEPLREQRGQGLGHGCPIPYPHPHPHPYPEHTGVVDIHPDGAALPSPPPPVSDDGSRYPLLARFAGEVAQYNQRPLAEAGAYPAATLDGVEANLRDLQAAATALKVDDVREVTLRLRRPANLAELRKASCPAVIIGRMAEYALRDLQPRLEEEDYRDGRGHNTELSPRAAQLMQRT